MGPAPLHKTRDNILSETTPFRRRMRRQSHYNARKTNSTNNGSGKLVEHSNKASALLWKSPTKACTALIASLTVEFRELLVIDLLSRGILELHRQVFRDNLVAGIQENHPLRRTGPGHGSAHTLRNYGAG